MLLTIITINNNLQTVPTSNVGAWKHDMYQSPGARRLNSAGNNGFMNVAQSQSSGNGKLVISNLEFSVSDNDIRVSLKIFSCK